MLTLKQIRENKEEVIRRLAVNHFDGAAIVGKIIELDDRRKAIQLQLDTNLAEQNSLARQIGKLFAEGKSVEANVLRLEQPTLRSSQTTNAQWPGWKPNRGSFYFRYLICRHDSVQKGLVPTIMVLFVRR